MSVRAVGLVVVAAAATILAGCSSSSKSTSSSSATSAATSAAAPTSAVGSSSGATGSTYVIGAIETESMPPTENNNDVSTTLKDWQTYVNGHGGINGHQVKVVAIDDGGDPGKSAAAYQRLASQHVLAIVDGTEVDTTWAKSAAAAKIPVLCGEMVADAFTCSSNPDFFPAGGNVLPELYGDFATAKTYGARTVATIYCVEIAACKQALPVIDGFTKALGLKELPSLGASTSASSYAAQCLALKSENVEAVFVAGPPSPKVTGDCAQQGYKPLYIEASGTWYNSFVGTPTLNNSAVGTVSNFPWFINNTPATQAFHAALGNFINTAYSPYNLITTWAAGMLFQAAAAHAGSNPTGADILAGLYSLKGDTLGGFSPPLTFTPGQSHSVPYYYPIALKNGKWVSPNGGQPVQDPIAKAS